MFIVRRCYKALKKQQQHDRAPAGVYKEPHFHQDHTIAS